MNRRVNVVPLSVSSSHIQVLTMSYGVYFLNTSQDFPALSTHFPQHLGSGYNHCSPGHLLVSPNWSAHILSRLPLCIHSILWPKYPSDLDIDQVTPSYNPSVAPYCPQEDFPKWGPRHDLAPSPSSSILVPPVSLPFILSTSHTTHLPYPSLTLGLLHIGSLSGIPCFTASLASRGLPDPCPHWLSFLPASVITSSTYLTV